jgi:hypothetical protein
VFVSFTADDYSVNIANAKVFGLSQDLKLTGNRYNVALVIFFVPYILFEVPSNVGYTCVPAISLISHANDRR